MTKLFLDCEYNGFGGKLMSMALVPEDESKPEFYREIEFTGQLEPWVRDNVVPHFTEVPVSHLRFQSDLAHYLFTIGECTIVADWPEDINHFCESLITGPGQRINTPRNIKFELDLSIEYGHITLYMTPVVSEKVTVVPNERTNS